MPRPSDLQSTVHHIFQVEGLNDGSFSANNQWDTAGLSAVSIIAGLGSAFAGALTKIDVHASDTSGFSPGAGNLVSEVETVFPDAAYDLAIVDLGDLTDVGRYVKVVVTAAAGASLVACYGVGFAKDGRGLAAADRGAVNIVQG